MTETHPFQPYIPDDPRLLILGTFPPQPKRWRMDFYYPNWNNDFWRICGLVFYGDKNRFCDPVNKRFLLPGIMEFLERHRIAMSDTATEVVRLKDNASDKFLDIRKRIDIHRFLDLYPTLDTIVTTGEKAAQVIAELTGTTPPAMGESTDFTYGDRLIRHYRMPSTSRVYPLPIEQKAAMYARVLARP